MELSSDDGSLELVQEKIKNNTASDQEREAFVSNYLNTKIDKKPKKIKHLRFIEKYPNVKFKKY